MSEITSKWESIGPATAVRYLESMNGNRVVRQSHVDFLHAQMKAGLWRKTHQGIAFDDDGHMIDGQHRMWAIIESGCTIPMYVSHGVNPEDVAAVDTHASRNFADHAHYQGWDTNPIAAGIAKLLGTGIGNRNRKVPAQVVQDWYKHYQKGVDFAVELRNSSRPSRGKSMTSSMATAFARAVYSVDTDMLTRMGEILKSGQLAVDADRAAFVLRDAWLSKRLGAGEYEQYMKTEAAIRAFVDRRTIRNLQAPQSELFPIPKLPTVLQFNPPTARRRKLVVTPDGAGRVKVTT